MKNILSLIIFMFLLVSISGCDLGKNKKNSTAGQSTKEQQRNNRNASVENKNNYKILAVSRTNIEQVVEENGEIAPMNQVDVTSKISGRVIKTIADEGMNISRGMQMAIVEPDSSQSRSLTSVINGLDDAKQDYQTALDDYNQQKTLLEKGFISQQVFKDAEARYLKADRNLKARQSDYDSAKNELGMNSLKVEKLQINAPISGIVLNRYVDDGELITGDSSTREGTKLFTVADLSKLVIRINVNEVDIYKLDSGQKVAIHILANAATPYSGVVSKISPYAENRNGIRTFKVDIRIDQQDKKLRPGMSASISMKLKARNNVIAVPVTALFVDDKQEYVFTPGKDGKAEKVYVKRGLNDEYNVEILSGLQPEARIFSDIPVKELDNFIPQGGKK